MLIPSHADSSQLLVALFSCRRSKIKNQKASQRYPILMLIRLRPVPYHHHHIKLFHHSRSSSNHLDGATSVRSTTDVATNVTALGDHAVDALGTLRQRLSHS